MLSPHGSNPVGRLAALTGEKNGVPETGPRIQENLYGGSRSQPHARLRIVLAAAHDERACDPTGHAAVRRFSSKLSTNSRYRRAIRAVVSSVVRFAEKRRT